MLQYCFIDWDRAIGEDWMVRLGGRFTVTVDFISLVFRREYCSEKSAVNPTSFQLFASLLSHHLQFPASCPLPPPFSLYFIMGDQEPKASNNDHLVQSDDPNHPANLIPELCKRFYQWGWVTGTDPSSGIAENPVQ